jgi:hypothetical protein
MQIDRDTEIDRQINRWKDRQIVRCTDSLKEEDTRLDKQSDRQKEKGRKRKENERNTFLN